MRSDYDIIRVTSDKDMLVCPISDVHIGALTHMEQEWQQFCQSVKQRDLYLTLGGDIVNNNVIGSVGNPWEERLRPADQKRLAVKLLEPIRDRILCIIPGNHEQRRGNRDVDDDPMYDIAAKLDLEDIYRQNMAIVQIQMSDCETRNKTRHTYSIVVTHGAGGGALTGGAVNRAERWGQMIDGADVIVLGHTHKGFVTRPQKIVIDPRFDTATLRPYTVLTAESWLGYGDYALAKQLPAAESGNPQVLRMCRRHKRVEVVW